MLRSIFSTLRRWLVLFVALLGGVAERGPTLATEPAIATAVDFNRDVRPILSEHCYTCHGPDAGTLMAGLRLDHQRAVFSPAESGAAPVVPGVPQASELVRRIEAGEEEVMPPHGEGKPLTKPQIALLRRWVQEGAVWAEHWAFAPIRRPSVPRESLADGEVHNPIDAFALAKLQSLGLTQAPREERARLLRRVSLDLTGIPPSPRDVADFLRDESPNAFEKVVDRLLSSQHFGERMALPWLDLARYGDTSGYHNDSLRDMWLWREWVVDAWNDNMPFDQFTIEQLAGDLLPAATISQRVATGFHRNVMTSDEGGLIDAEYRNLYVVDRVATTGVTWLGMTVGCAQCHDHKYDPISQADFYRLYAFFNQVPENGKDGVRDSNPPPFLQVPSPQQAAERQRHQRDLEMAEARLAALTEQLPIQQAAWERAAVEQAGEAVQAGEVAPLAEFYFPLDAQGDGANDEGPVRGEPQGTLRFEPGVVGQSLAVSKQQWLQYPERFDFERDQAFTVAAFLYVTPAGGSPFGKMDDRQQSRGWDVEFHGLRPSVHLIHRWPDEALHIQAEEDLPVDTFSHLAVSYDGSGQAAGLKLYVDGLPLKTTVKVDNLQGSIRNTLPFFIGRRGPDSTPFAGRIDELRIDRRELSPAEIATVAAAPVPHVLRLPADQRTPLQQQLLEKYFRQSQMPELAEAEKSVAALRKVLEDFDASVPNTMVMAELEQPRETFLKIRGNYDQDGQRVEAAFPEFLSHLEDPTQVERRLDRLDLARWLVSPRHPLTARVTVNRWWAMLFGTGIVKTLNDFGAQGERPSHPELLDWLAADLLRDWDTKRVIKQMVLSATYQQTCRVSPELLARDQENRFLARGPRQRLDAETLRDNALAIAGILNPTLGGPSIKPYQPAGTWEINEMSGYKYEQSRGGDLYRRGLYVYWRRSTVYPSFVTLDAPTREFCVAQRAKTSTPLQALVLMNDPVFVEAARGLAQRVLAQPMSGDAERLSYAWRLALAREPSAREMTILTRTLEQQMATYQQDGQAAQQLLAVGDLPLPAEAEPWRLAAWIALSNVLLNLNETISN